MKTRHTRDEPAGDRLRSRPWPWPSRAAGAAIALGLLCASLLPARHRERPILERETTRRSFELAAGAPARLVVDNYFGRVEIRPHDAPRIDLELTRTVRGDSPEKLEQARSEVRLEITADDGIVDLYVDTPYRQEHWRDRRRHWRDPGYRVIYDFVLAAPPTLAIEIKTVSDGDVDISGIRGGFDVANVNGSVTLRAMSGSGSAETVNGGVRVEFLDNPSGDSRFSTVNGDIDVVFLPGLDADLWMQSGFGELWSDFEVRPLPARPTTESVEDGRRVIRTDPGARVRVGAGGPSHSFKTLTGDVLIRRADRSAGGGSTPSQTR